MSKIESATRWMENLAADNSHGYSQASRWGPDYDCSSAVIQAWDQAGLPVKKHGATYTGNMRSAFLASGFKNVTNSVNLATGEGLHRGDVLLDDLNHTAMYIGSGRIVHARSSEGNSMPGDQSGNEIRTQAYYNHPWLCVLRYPEVIDYEEPKKQKSEKTGLVVDGECGPATWAALIRRMPTVRNGSESWAVTALQAMLNFLGAELDADGDCGPLTVSEIMNFQKGEL